MSAVAPLPERMATAVLETALQPIVALNDEHVLGYEALTRVRGGTIGVAQLFERAAGRRRATELNLAAIRTALGATPRLPPHALLFVNADPVVLASPELSWILREGSGRTGFPLDRLVVEITERSGFTDVSATTRVLEDLRASGVRYALDDFGSAHSHLTLIDVIRPSFIKIGNELGTAFEENATRTHIVRHITALARDFECSTILEGVETKATADAAASLGIQLAQGYHFGRPVAAPHWSPSSGEARDFSHPMYFPGAGADFVTSPF
jgi:EAL domain-containing protein (putative c-di-GMP-specific phosphodiesterase class I)